jgi:ABC-type Fe3+ transport system permease subunit
MFLDWMEVVKILLIILILALAVPVGYWLAYLCKDELVKGRKWFRHLITGSIILSAASFFYGFYEITLTFLFILIVSWISYVKSGDKEISAN